MITEAVILAGGLGTRLRSEVSDRPKVLAEVNGRPFIHFVLDYLVEQGMEHVILSVGYMGELIEKHLGSHYENVRISYVYEEIPMGTGGGIYLSLKEARQDVVAVVNGDTIFQVDLQSMADYHKANNADFTLALKRMENFDRYGTVEVDDNGYVTAFKEKTFMDQGLINGGVYTISRHDFVDHKFKLPFSLEQDYFEKYLKKDVICGIECDAYFLDIGISEDYKRAQLELK